MRKPVSLIIAFFLLSSSSLPEQRSPLDEADLMLDMMEYRAAIVNYMKALSQNPRQQNIRKNIGYAYFQLDKIDDVLKYLKQELELFPENEDAYDLLVYVLYKQEKLEEVDRILEDYHFSATLSEENPHLGGLGCFILGMHHKKIESFGKAEVYFRKAIEKGYDPVMCYVQLIDYEVFQKESKFTLQFGPIINIGARLDSILAEAVAVYQVRPEFLFILGLRYFENYFKNTKYLIMSIKAFELASKLKPRFKDALFNLACLSYNFNDFKKASEYFREILDIEPGNAEVRVYLNCCLEKLGTSEVSIPGKCPSWINLSRKFIDEPDMEYEYQFKNDISFVIRNIDSLALEFISQGRFQEALKRFRNGLKIDPGNPGFYYNLGIVHTWLGDLEEAEKNYLCALKERDFFGTLPGYRKQEILRRKKRDRQKKVLTPLSEWTFEVALEEGNDFIDAYTNLGSLYFKKKEIEKSILAYKKVIEIHPDDAMGRYNLGCSYKVLKDRKNAEKEWKKAIRHEEKLRRIKERGEISENQLDVSLLVYKRPVSFRAHKELGWLYLEENLPEKALKEFEKAMELEPSDPEPYYEVGKIYQQKSVQDEKYVRKAVFYYEKYLYLGGEKEEEVKKMLKLLK